MHNHHLLNNLIKLKVYVEKQILRIIIPIFVGNKETIACILAFFMFNFNYKRMGKVDRKTKSIKIDISHFGTEKPKHVDSYSPNDDYDYDGGFSTEELEELGAISYPKTRKIIPDGETAFFSMFKQGEDF